MPQDVEAFGPQLDLAAGNLEASPGQVQREAVEAIEHWAPRLLRSRRLPDFKVYSRQFQVSFKTTGRCNSSLSIDPMEGRKEGIRDGIENHAPRLHRDRRCHHRFIRPDSGWTQTWPSRPIKIVCGYPAGGLVDSLARLYGEYLSQKLGQPVIVENKAGASGSIGAGAVKQSPPDGYTLLVATTAVLAQNRVLFKTLPYDPDRDSCSFPACRQDICHWSPIRRPTSPT